MCVSVCYCPLQITCIRKFHTTFRAAGVCHSEKGKYATCVAVGIIACSVNDYMNIEYFVFIVYVSVMRLAWLSRIYYRWINGGALYMSYDVTVKWRFAHICICFRNRQYIVMNYWYVIVYIPVKIKADSNGIYFKALNFTPSAALADSCWSQKKHYLSGYQCTISQGITWPYLFQVPSTWYIKMHAQTDE